MFACLQHVAVASAELLADLLPRPDQKFALRQALADVRIFLECYHSVYFSRYCSAWAVACEDAATQLAAELRTNAQRYKAPIGTDGSLVSSPVLAAQMSIVHTLIVCGFLTQQALQPAEALKLLEHLRPAIHESDTYKGFATVSSCHSEHEW